MGSGEPLGAARLRAAARSVARQLSHFLGKRLVHRPRVLAGDGGRDALGVVGQVRVHGLSSLASSLLYT